MQYHPSWDILNKMRTTFNLISIFVVCLVTVSANAQLSGKIKENFLDSFTQSCYNTQRSASINKSATDKSLYQYCKCNAHYLANLMNNKLAKSIEDGEQQFNASLLQMASNYCMNNYSKY